MYKSLSGMFQMDMKNQKEKLSPEAKHITVIKLKKSWPNSRVFDDLQSHVIVA